MDNDALVAPPTTTAAAVAATAAVEERGGPASPRLRARARGLRILIVDDHALFADSLHLVLTRGGHQVDRADLLAPGPDPTGRLLRQVEHRRPDVVLLDLDLGALGDGTALIPGLSAAGAAVVVVTACEDVAVWGGCLQQGARTVLSKSRPLEEIRDVLGRFRDHLPVLDVAERELLVSAWRARQRERQDKRDRLDLLTARESEVLGHLTLGRPVSEIAALSVVSEATVRTQVKAILAKLQVSSQIAAVGLAYAVEWEPPVE